MGKISAQNESKQNRLRKLWFVVCGLFLILVGLAIAAWPIIQIILISRSHSTQAVMSAGAESWAILPAFAIGGTLLALGLSLIVLAVKNRLPADEVTKLQNKLRELEVTSHLYRTTWLTTFWIVLVSSLIMTAISLFRIFTIGLKFGLIFNISDFTILPFSIWLLIRAFFMLNGATNSFLAAHRAIRISGIFGLLHLAQSLTSLVGNWNDPINQGSAMPAYIAGTVSMCIAPALAFAGWLLARPQLSRWKATLKPQAS